MFFLLTHHIVQDLIPWKEGTKDSRKNITTFVGGGLLYVFLLSFLHSPSQKTFIESNFVLFTLRNWLMLIAIIDVTAMAIIYKCYYNRSIVNEVPEILAANIVDKKEKTDEIIKAHAEDDDFADEVAKDIGKKSFEDEVKEAHSNEIDEDFIPEEDRKPAKRKKPKKAREN